MKKTINNKGITLIALILTIIILIVLAAIGTYSGVQVIKSAQLTAFSTELKIMQTQVNALYDKKKNNEKVLINNIETNIDDIGSEISNSEVNVQTQANIVFTALGISNQSTYKYYNNATIKSLNIDGVEGDFFVNIDKRSVISYEGLNFEGITYYTLEQLENNSLYNVEYTEMGGKPTFESNYHYDKNNDIYTINIFDVEYNNGNIAKWNVEYRLQTNDTWNTSDSLTFTVRENGQYQIRVKNGENIVSEPIEIDVEPNYYLIMMEETKDNYIGKTNIGTIDEFRELVNKGDFNYEIAYVIEDIQMGCDENNVWVPIGTSSHPFNQIIEGNKHEISGLYIENDNNDQGLFGYNYGDINNINITGEIKTSTSIEIGGITGINYGDIYNCTNNVEIKGGKVLGGIAGKNLGDIRHCVNQNSIYGFIENDSSGCVGGIVGDNRESGCVKGCENIGDLHSKSNCTGGIIGFNKGKTSICVNEGTIESSSNATGGIVGYQQDENAVISNCYNTGEINGKERCGGIIGHCKFGTTKNCYNIEEITGIINLGSIIGLNEENGVIQNCYYKNSLSLGLYGSNTGTIDMLSTSKSEEQMKSIEFITTLNVDDTIFKQDYMGVNSINNGFPILNWQ